MTKSNLVIPIVTYHSVDGSGSVISTDAGTLARQMEHLALAGYRSVSLQEAAGLLSGAQPPQSPMIALTFDDGFSSVCDVALPILRDFGFTATVFLVTDSLGAGSPWLGAGERIARFRVMNAREVERLLAAGWQIGGHSATHRILTDLPDDQLNRELDRCLSALHSLSGQSGFWLAYPYGAFDGRVRDSVRQRFAGACSTLLGFASPHSDLFALERIDMYYLKRPVVYRSLGSRRFAAYLAFRRLLRHLRARAKIISHFAVGSQACRQGAQDATVQWKTKK